MRQRGWRASWGYPGDSAGLLHLSLLLLSLQLHLLLEKPAPEVKEGFIKVPKKDLKRAHGILKDILAGRRVRVSGAT